MKYSELKQILRDHGLRVTDGRMDILHYFIGTGKALSIKDLEEEFGNYDRVTLYRTLQTFDEHGLIHKIPDDTGIVTYGVCHDTCDSDAHHHNHMHFKCNNCGETQCLEQDLPAIRLPGFVIEEANMLLHGKCQRCAQSN